MSKNLSAKSYQENKKKTIKKSCERYQNLSEEEKEKKPQYGCKRFKNLSEDEKQKLLEYRRKYFIENTEKKCFIIIIRNYYFKIQWLEF